ncbi:hypothetical protein CBL_20796 [Carabus blaptoides fortunei]
MPAANAGESAGLSHDLQDRKLDQQPRGADTTRTSTASPGGEQKPQSETSEDNTSQPKVVYNLSDEALDKDTAEVLTKGFNFAVAPLRIPVEEIVCSVESAIQKLEKDTAETIRQEVSRVLRRAKPPKKNISKEEYTALKKLRDNQNIIVLPADKGNATVMVNSADYKNKMTAILADLVYKPITSDPTIYLEKTTKKKSKQCH